MDLDEEKDEEVGHDDHEDDTADEDNAEDEDDEDEEDEDDADGDRDGDESFPRPLLLPFFFLVTLVAVRFLWVVIRHVSTGALSVR